MRFAYRDFSSVSAIGIENVSSIVYILGSKPTHRLLPDSFDHLMGTHRIMNSRFSQFFVTNLVLLSLAGSFSALASAHTASVERGSD
jgi:hypothetical protein